MFDLMDMAFSADAEQDFSGPYLPEASECMRCGQCVSHCPTYKLFEIDAQTPRSRIRTIDKLLNDQAVTDDELIYLNDCLQCRACEPACPSKMAYGYFFDQAQAKLEKHIPVLAKWALWFVEHKRWRSGMMPLLWFYRKTFLPKLLRDSRLLEKLGLAEAEALLTTPALSRLSEHYPAPITRRGRVALFTGCIAEHFDRETLDSATRLLNAIGFDVLIPPEQGCCGAIHQHNGLAATDLIENNLKLFKALDAEAVLYAASGCGVMLSEYPNDADSEGLIQDINRFLLAHWPQELALKPADLTVAVHEPCSQRNVLKTQQAVYDLLAKIPNLKVQALPDNAVCCGAGGSYMLTHPDNAQKLRRAKVDLINGMQPDYVVSSNFGCAVFLSGDSLKIRHPLTLLARQL